MFGTTGLTHILSSTFVNMFAGDFSYTQGSLGWTDSSIGSQAWLYKNSTSEGTITGIASFNLQLCSVCHETHVQSKV